MAVEVEVEEEDIRRTARLLIEQHGNHAALVAVRHAEEKLARGDESGCRVWVRISRTIDTLAREKPREGEATP
jgi:hypothetical protein